MKKDTDIIVNITTSPKGQAVIMCVKTFKTNVIIFISNIINMCLRSN